MSAIAWLLSYEIGILYQQLSRTGDSCDRNIRTFDANQKAYGTDRQAFMY